MFLTYIHTYRHTSIVIDRTVFRYGTAIMARRTICRYLIYSEVDFSVFVSQWRHGAPIMMNFYTVLDEHYNFRRNSTQRRRRLDFLYKKPDFWNHLSRNFACWCIRMAILNIPKIQDGHIKNQAYSKYKHSLIFRVRRYVVIVTKPVHRLQIRPIVHN